MRRLRKPTFGDLVNALQKLVNTDIERGWVRSSVGGYEDIVYLEELATRTKDPVVRLLATMAMRAR